MKRIASSQKGVMKESEPESESSNGLKDAIKGFLEKRIGRIIAGGAAGIAGKKALEKGAEKAIGKTAEKVTGAVGKEVAEKGAEKAVQKTAEKVTGEVAKKVAEKGAEEVAEQGIKSKIEKVVSGKLTKFIFSSGAKKVPIAGAIIGAIFGVKKLFEGDTVGAGMEVASGAAGTIPIAGTAASLGIDAAGLARDVYKEVFGKFPEEEPELAKQRMTLIANIIEDQIKSKSSPDKETENQEKKTSNQVTPANTSDAKSSNTTTPLSTSDSKSSNTTTPANTSDAKSSNTTTPANTSDAKSSNTTTPLSTTKSTSTNTKRVSAPESNSSDTSYKLADVTAKVPVGKTLQELLDENQNLNIEESTTKNTQVKPNQINISSPATQDKSGLIIEKYIHPVRNQEVTFRNMIFNSTRVV